MSTLSRLHQLPVKSLVLLIALLALLVATPHASATGGTGISMQVFYLAVFCVAGYLLFHIRSWVIVYLGIALFFLIFGLLSDALPGNRFILAGSALASAALKTVLFVAVIRFSLYQPGASRADRIVAGICGYLLLGLFWVDLYELAMILHAADAFRTPGGMGVLADRAEAIYFSFITLTTLGYGDIIPIHPWVRILAILEAICGTLYLAVLISSLVSRQEKQETP
jgi:voltage-gated potassium channel Kch